MEQTPDQTRQRLKAVLETALSAEIAAAKRAVGRVECPCCEGTGVTPDVRSTTTPQDVVARRFRPQASMTLCSTCDGTGWADQDAAAEWLLANDPESSMADLGPVPYTAAEVAKALADVDGVAAVAVADVTITGDALSVSHD